MHTIAIIGAGAAGYFAAIRHKELYPHHHVILFEKTSKVLGKVKISGGGRCNVTHACFIPKELVVNYPRGGKELLPLFYRFQPGDTIEWFEKKGVHLKIEDDGRMFPTTDRSQTIIDCLENARISLGIDLKLNHELIEIKKNNSEYTLVFRNGHIIQSQQLLIAGGSSERLWNIIKSLGHTVIEPLPSLFTFNIKDRRIQDCPGSSWSQVEIKLEGTKWKTNGPLLVTHWGLSGPAVLKLSSYAARDLFEKNYKVAILINFCFPYSTTELVEWMQETKLANSNKLILNTPYPAFSQKLWESFMRYQNVDNKRWQEISNKQILQLSIGITQARFEVEGKSTFKEEFVTCGGVDLKEINMKTMQSKICPGIFFAGEILNIDALTGGFNFQAAWTTAWIAGSNDNSV